MRIAIIAAIAGVGALGGFGVLLASCQNSDVSRAVGARCERTSECDERCLTPSATYPNGFCTIACAGRSECPDRTTCADRDGGICLFECTSNTDCAFLGNGWTCRSANLHGGGIQVMVCSG